MGWDGRRDGTNYIFVEPSVITKNTSKNNRSECLLSSAQLFTDMTYFRLHFPILLMKKLRYRDVKSRGQVLTACKWKDWNPES